MDLTLDSQIPLELALPQPALHQNVHFVSDGNLDSERTDLPLDSFSKQVPLVFEGSVENFDPIKRANELAKKIPRKWCGTYKPFSKGSNVDVIFTLSKVTPVGQIIDLKGKMRFGSFTTSVRGNLNAKSGQVDLIPLSDVLMHGLEPGGMFTGLQGLKLLGWESSNFENPGGRLELNQLCKE